MKLSKPALAAGALTLMFVFFTLGYFTADAGKRGFTVSAERETEIKTELSPVPLKETPIPAASETEKINISTASREELMTLPGIGEIMADRIIEFREENGPFSIIEDITLVKGIGQATFDKLEEYITVK